MPILTMGLTLHEMNRVSPGTGGTSHKNICVTTIGNDGVITKYGFLDSSYGVITPNATLEGIDIFEVTWQADGTFIISFGDGTEQLTNVNSILINHHTVPDGNIAIWDSVNTCYTFTDNDLADYIIDGSYTEMCFYVELIPDTLIYYTFTELLTGTRT